MKTLRKYLFHIQESVFEGELTPRQYRKLNEELEKIIGEEDQVIFYFTYKPKDLNKRILGKSDDKSEIII